MEFNGGENWLSADEAADRLGVDVDAIHTRIRCGWLESRLIGNGPHLREADVERLAQEGLPYADFEARLSGAVVALPDEWLSISRPNSRYGPSGFVALKPMVIGRNRRPLFPGDVVAADDGPVSDSAISRGEFAELPLRYGVLALLTAYQQRIARLEVQLAQRENA